MPATARQTLMHGVRRPVLWCLVLALMVYGHSSVMVQLLGPAHRHVAAAATAPASGLDRADTVFSQVLAWRAALRARLLPDVQAHGPHRHGHDHGPAGGLAHHGGPPHTHGHAAYQRHHHDPHDASVVALDAPGEVAASDAASAAGSGSATLPLALAPRWAPAMAAEPASTWSDPASARWTDATVHPLEQPPRA